MSEAEAMEANEVARPTAHQLLEETRMEMEDVASKMLFIKQEGSSKSELRELITQMSLHFITLRKVPHKVSTFSYFDYRDLVEP